ncbi:MAG: uncharacterized protein PWQ77_1763 [Kosmotogales bacterium]|nr:uncharacterized protein [Kosmotogales bacterium]
MEYRKLGKTGLNLSLLGLGGFHLLEVDFHTVRNIVKAFLDSGGNYIETAHSYGNGLSERKLGKILPKNGIIVATKTEARDAETAKNELMQSLKNLNRENIDILFLHSVTRDDDWEKIKREDGSLELIEWAKKKGFIRYVGITSHGYSGTLLKALKEYPFDLFMTGINYYDRFNFPEIESEVIPYAAENDIGILAMKTLADGYLWRNAEYAFRYTKRFPVTTIVSGINSMEQLEKDLSLIHKTPLADEELIKLITKSPELGNYVCRQCMKCLPCPEDIDIPALFLAEGRFDRQMMDGRIGNAPDYAIRDRLAHWFGSEETALSEFNSIEPGPDKCTECGICSNRCPYKIDIPRKLKIVKSKLEEGYIW